MEEAGAKLPDHERAYRRLRKMILHGDLAPGQAVTIQGLIETLGLGMTPVREAIRRLTSQGALHLQGNRRVSVPVLDAGQMEQIAFARMELEPKMASMAVENMDESDVCALETIDRDLNAAIARGDVHGYLTHNTRFHFELYRHARAEVLMSIVEMLWLRGGPSLRVVLGRKGTANLPDMHAEAIAAIRARDAEAVAAAVEADIGQGIDQIRQSLSQTPG